MKQFICLWTRLFVILSFCVVGSLPLGAVGSSIDYFTAIKRACDKGTLKCVNTWEKEHPNANYRNMTDDEFGDTPMHHAVRHNGPLELLLHLMNRGLYDADRGNTAGQTVMQLAQAQDDDVQEEGSTRVLKLAEAIGQEEVKKKEQAQRVQELKPKARVQEEKLKELKRRAQLKDSTRPLNVRLTREEKKLLRELKELRKLLFSEYCFSDSRYDEKKFNDLDRDRGNPIETVKKEIRALRNIQDSRLLSDMSEEDKEIMKNMKLIYRHLYLIRTYYNQKMSGTVIKMFFWVSWETFMKNPRGELAHMKELIMKDWLLWEVTAMVGLLYCYFYLDIGAEEKAEKSSGM